MITIQKKKDLWKVLEQDWKQIMYRMDQTFEFRFGLANKMEYLGTGVLFWDCQYI